jgi:hypothetical protein
VVVHWYALPFGTSTFPQVHATGGDDDPPQAATEADATTNPQIAWFVLMNIRWLLQ